MNEILGYFIILLSLLWTIWIIRNPSKGDSLSLLINIRSVFVSVGLLIIGILLILKKITFL